MRQLYKFSSLINRDGFTPIAAFLLLGLVKFGLWLLPYARLEKILILISDRSSRNQKVIELDKIVRSVNISSRYMPGGAKCLAKALTTQVLMKRYGYLPQLCIGVTKGEQEQLEAHAWVEHQGEIVIGSLHDLSRYTRMSSMKS